MFSNQFHLDLQTFQHILLPWAGKPVYNEYYLNREKMEALEKKVKEIDAASTTTLIGQRLILEQEVKRTGVSKPLSRVFGIEDSERIMALASSDICRGKAFSRSPQWLDTKLHYSGRNTSKKHYKSPAIAHTNAATAHRSCLVHIKNYEKIKNYLTIS